MTYLNGGKGRIVMQMYRGKAFGISFPTDGDRHNEDWEKQEIERGPFKITIRYHKGKPDDLIAIEVDLPPEIMNLEVHSE